MLTWYSFNPVSSTDYMDILFLDGLYSNMLYIQNLLAEALYIPTSLEEIDTSQLTQTIPIPIYINKIENNLKELVEATPWPTKTLPQVEWLGELKDTRFLSYIDVNRWFDTLEQLKSQIESIPSLWRIAGTFYAGNNIRVQTIRRD